MTASMAGYVFNDALVKLVSENLGLYQIMLLRGLFTTTLLGLIAWRMKSLFPKLKLADWRLMTLRMIGEVGGTLCFLTALFNMPIANASAILQVVPLAVTYCAAIFLGQAVGWRRFLAIFIGFAGVLMIVRPGAEGFNAYSLWALAAVVFVVLRDLVTHRMSAQMPSIFAALLTSVSITLTGAVLSPTVAWQPVGLDELKLLGAAASFLIFGYLFGIMTMRVGEISFISPFRYSALVWSIILGVVVFGDVPGTWTLLGSAIVVAMGIFTFYRERKAERMAGLAETPT
ncbi:MAG: DMT family transporter [Rhodospirillaceae bacterium]|nr:DMT family transporter [Rhodospirillaceae bacterium]